MNITFITTLEHNVGDDFVREGIAYLLSRYFENEDLCFESIHKHAPITATYGFEKVRSRAFSAIVDTFVSPARRGDRILQADLVVQSGAPVYWCNGWRWGGHCAHNEWYRRLIKKRFRKNLKAKLLNLGAGTCQRYYSDGSDFCSHCRHYIKDFFETATVTTVRDKLAKEVLNSIGLDAPVIPCPSIFAVDRHGARSKGEEYVVLNYMDTGGHYTFGQDINTSKWKDDFTRFYHEVKKNDEVRLVCHNRKELEQATRIDSAAEVFYSNNYLDYINFYSRAKYGVMNRVHGAFMLASFGKPAVVIGADSRAKMISEVGLTSIFVKNVDFDVLMEQYEYLQNGATGFNARFKTIKKIAYRDYMKALSLL